MNKLYDLIIIGGDPAGLSEFPDLKNKYKVMSVPAMIINDEKVYFVANNIEEIIDMIG